MLTDIELEVMKNSSVLCFKKLCHRIVDVIDFKVMERENGEFSCVLEGIVGSARKRKVYSYDLTPSHKKEGRMLVSNIKITEVQI
jgi:hypothetical protein